MMIKSSALLLALGSIAAAASINTAEVSSLNNEDLAWDYQVVDEPNAADDRGLLRSATECITIRYNGDSNADDNSIILKDLTTGATLHQNLAGSLAPNTQVDSECITADPGNLLKLTATTPSGRFESGAFFALFVGSLRWNRIEGSDMGTVYNSCFRLISSEPYIEDAECASTTAATTATGNPPAPSPPAPYVPFSSRMGCGSGEKKVKIIFEKDNYNENKWQVKSRSSGQTVWNCNANGNYCLTETAEKCLREDDYDVIMEDGNSDGCPRFELHMEDSSGQWRPLITKCYNGATWTRHFHTRQVSMTQRERQWLDAHNSRRQTYWYDGSSLRNNGNPYYVKQEWDPSLASQAQSYANQLLAGCETDTMPHDPNRNGAGENMAKNRGAPGSEYGSQYSPDNILNRFVEMEMDNQYGNRYHLTQALWKASAYVGCADGFKEYVVNGVTKHCHTQVCRYAAPGNCGINGDNDLRKMMMDADDQNCGMRWPPNGMYAA